MRESNDQLTGAFLFGAHMDPIMDIVEIENDLTVGDLEMEVKACPGHAPGLISIITRDSRKLFCGDLLFCDGGVGRWDLPGGNLEQLRSSLKESLTWDVTALYPGHGREETSNPEREMNLSMGMLSSI